MIADHPTDSDATNPAMPVEPAVPAPAAGPVPAEVSLPPPETAAVEGALEGAETAADR